MAADANSQFMIGQVTSRFAVSISFVDKLLKRQRTSGLVAAPRGGPAPRLQEVDRQRLATCVATQPDATLAELGQQLVATASTRSLDPDSEQGQEFCNSHHAFQNRATSCVSASNPTLNLQPNTGQRSQTTLP